MTPINLDRTFIARGTYQDSEREAKRQAIIAANLQKVRDDWKKPRPHKLSKEERQAKHLAHIAEQKRLKAERLRKEEEEIARQRQIKADRKKRNAINHQNTIEAQKNAKAANKAILSGEPVPARLPHTIVRWIKGESFTSESKTVFRNIPAAVCDKPVVQKKPKVVSEKKYKRQCRAFRKIYGIPFDPARYEGDPFVVLKQMLRRVHSKKTDRCHSKLYVDYMASPAWFAKRREAFAIHGYACKKCGTKKRIQVHHLTYVNLGHENAETELEVLCRPCHEKEHGRKFN